MNNSDSRGFTLFELLIVLGIIGIMCGFGVSAMPRLLSGSSPDSVARRLAGAGLESRQMALLRQSPWEIIIDLDQGLYYSAPQGAVSRMELREADPIKGEKSKEEDLLTTSDQKEKKLDQPIEQRQKTTTVGLRTKRAYDVNDYTMQQESVADIKEEYFPEEVKVLQVWTQEQATAAAGRISVVFSPRGFCQPTAIWLADEEYSVDSQYTVFFPGLLSPQVVRGLLLPNADGVLIPVE